MAPPMSDAQKKKFKDWFDSDAAAALGKQISAAHPAFDRQAFVKTACKNLTPLEMNDRVAQFSGAMARYLPEDKDQALRVLTRSLPERLPDTDQVTDGWLQWPVGKFIADYGLPHFETSMTAMIELTQRFSSEFAVRPFLEQRQAETLARLKTLTNHPSPHVRRWCSEGTRPLLPWGKKLHALLDDPSPVWPILEDLKDDPNRYVQKSVANHLNDISKHHPDLVVERCAGWMKTATPQRKWIIRHALRSLIKDGHPGALALRGYPPAKKLQADFTLSPESVKVGSSVALNLQLQNGYTEKQSLLIDYAVTYVRKQPGTGRKVFKWTTRELAPGETVKLGKKHPMKITSVRKLYPGKHRVEALVNGQVLARAEFELRLV